MKNHSYIKQLWVFILLIAAMKAHPQIVIGTPQGTPDSSAILDVRSTDKGFLIPRMDQSHIDAIDNPAEGLMIYNTTGRKFQFNYGNGMIGMGENGIDYTEETMFRKTVDVDGQDDVANAVCGTSDGGCIIAGGTRISVGNSTSGDLYFIKLTSKGTPDKNFGNGGIQIVHSSYGNEDAYCVRQTFDGGYIAIGYSSAVSPTSFCIVKLKADGEPDTQFGTNGIVTVNNGHSCYGRVIKQTADSGFIATGYAYQSDNKTDVFMVKLTKTGALDASFNGSGTLTFGIYDKYDRAYDMDISPDNKYYVTGYTQDGNNGGEDAFIARIKQDGSFDPDFNSGTMVFGSSGYERGYSVIALQDSGCIFSGYTGNGLFAVVFNKNGQLISSKKYTIPGHYFYEKTAMINIGDTNFIIGSTETADFNTYNAYLIKIRRSGNPEPVTGFGQNGSLLFGDRDENFLRGLSMDNSGEITAVGFTRTTNEDKDLYIVKLNGAGHSCGSTSGGGSSTLFGQTNTWFPSTSSGGNTSYFTVTTLSQGTVTTICQ